MIENNYLQLQESQYTPRRIKRHIYIPEHSIIKLLETKDKKKTLKEAKKKLITQVILTIRMKTTLSLETMDSDHYRLSLPLLKILGILLHPPG